MNKIILANAIYFSTVFFNPTLDLQPSKANLAPSSLVTPIATVSQDSDNSYSENNYLIILLICVALGTLGLATTFAVFRYTLRKINQKYSENNSEQNTEQNRAKESHIELNLNTNISVKHTVYIELAYSCFKKGNTKQALKNFKQAINIQPNNPKIYGERAYFRKIKLGDKQGAIEDYTQAININPHNPLFYFCRSQTYKELGLLQKAIEDYNKAMDIAQDNIHY